ncbi:MAG: fibronectin type III domain-containing protein [Caldilineaceae bacterium]|nr:fibronectin type III domain-containing protein [Caldilineaceae bacterium]
MSRIQITLLFLFIVAGAWGAEPAKSQGDPCAGVTDAPAADCNALVALYNATNGPNWTKRTNWLANNLVCSWHGVTCGGGRVTQLRLMANGLSGTVPPALANAQLLNWIELQNNQLTGPIPPELAQLSALTELALYQNSMTGPIPAQLGGLSNLSALRLGSNQLTGTIPPELGNLSELKALGINSNQLTGIIPPELGSLSKLELINAHGNQLTGPIPSTFNNFPEMWRLYLENNQLSGELPSGLSNLAKLRVFSIRNNRLSGPIPTSYTNLTAWNNVDLGYNMLTASDSALVNFLNAKDPDWAQTQTVAPTGVQATPQSGASVSVTWTPIPYTGDGGYYEVGFAASADGPFVVHGRTANKSANSYVVTGLSAQTTYDVVVRSFTPAHGEQVNELLSDYSRPASATTGAFSCGDVSQLPATECEALVALYNATTGPAWTNRTGWLQTSTPCSWHGVTCSGGRVTELNLSSNNLKGSLPPQIGNFPMLNNLAVRANQLSGSIPAEIGQLTALTRLTLSENQLTGDIPTTVGNLVNMEQFWLHYNQLTGPLPTQLGNLTRLKRFGAIDNRLSGTIPTQLGNLTNLTELYLNRNLFSGSIPPQIGNLTKLTVLLFVNNQLSGEIPTSFTNLTQVTNLNVGYNRLTASDPALLNFLAAKHPTWLDTQTLPPTNLQATAQSSFQIRLSWTPILYTADGGYYQVSMATAPGGPYAVQGVTADKTVDGFTVSGLSPATTYYFVVRTFTPAANVQKNNLWSNYSVEASATTQQETTPVAPTINSAPLTTALRGQPYAYSVVASGSAPLAFALVKGPDGMSVDPTTGLLSWTPSDVGSFAVTVRVSNAVGSAEQAFSVVVNDAPQITSTPVVAGLVAQPYAYDVDATGAPAPAFSLSLAPTGMTINATSGLINWTPATEGVYTVTVKAANPVGVDEQTFEINVSEVTEMVAPVILSEPPLAADVGKRYEYLVSASGVPAPVFSLVDAPAGMTINSTTGAVAWEPTDAGSFAVTIQVSNSAGDAQQSFTVVVSGVAEGDLYEDDDACERATTILTNGAKQQRNFHALGDVDWIRFEAQAFRTYIIEVINQGSLADAVVEIHDECDETPSSLANNAFGRSVRLEWDARRSGEYFLRLSQFDGASFGAEETRYEVRVTVDTTPPQAPQSPRCAPLNDRTLAVQWKKSPERDVRGYRVALTGVPSVNEDVPGIATTYVEITQLRPNQRYDVTVSAVDFSGNESLPSGVVRCLVAPPPDTTPPALTLSKPTGGGIYTTTAYSLTFTGVAQDDVNLARVQVRNATRNKEGWDWSLSGLSAPFRVSDIGLAVGDNRVEVMVFDDAGNMTKEQMVVRRLGEVQGGVIIMAGHNETFGLQRNIYNAANRAYRIFRGAGFTDEAIHYLSPVAQDATGDGVFDTDGPSRPADLEAAVTEWARGHVGPGKPLYIYLIDHGFADKFCAAGCSGGGAFTPAELDGWLRVLEAATGVDQVTIVIEACQSGSFLDRHNQDVANSLSKEGRVVITSTGRANNAYASAEGAYFSDAFFSCLAESNSMKVCYEQGVSAVGATGVDQTPWLDDNGDGVSNENDGAEADLRVVTRFFRSVRPTIREVSVVRNGANGVLTAMVEEGAEEVELVWATVYPPSFREPDTVTINLNAPTVRLEPTGEPGRYAFNYLNGFSEEGDYRIVFYAQDRLGIHGVPRREGELDSLYLPLISKN